MFTGKKYNYVDTCRTAISGGVLSTVALLFVIGAVVQVTTLTGAKGLLVLGAMVIGATAPALMYGAMAISLPLLGGVLTQLGTAVILGIPFELAMISKNQIAFVAGLSILCYFSQLVPPSALGGYFARDLAGETDYLPMLKKCIVPSVVTMAFAIVELIFADQFAAIFVKY